MKKNIFIIIGSASQNSSNERLVESLAERIRDSFTVTLFADLKSLPHFDPGLSENNTPKAILEFREKIRKADGLLICSPEYVFSIPSGLKNALEWCVSTTLFSDKPLGIITASADGEKGHEELQLIMKTLGANFTDHTTLLIRGIKGKINKQGQITDEKTKERVVSFTEGFKKLVECMTLV